MEKLTTTELCIHRPGASHNNTAKIHSYENVRMKKITNVNEITPQQ